MNVESYVGLSTTAATAGTVFAIITKLRVVPSFEQINRSMMPECVG